MRQKLHHTLVTPRVFSCLAALLLVSFVVTPLRGSASTSTVPLTPRSVGTGSHLRIAPSLPIVSSPSPSPTPVPTPSPYEISPSSGIQGKDFDVLVSSIECLQGVAEKSMSGFQLYAPTGSGIKVTGTATAGCRLTATLSIAPDAPIGIVKLQLKVDTNKSNQDANKKPILQEPIDFTVAGVTAGPIPPGLNNKGQVDVMWSVLPDGITDDNFGGKVKRQFYCIEVVIGNDSGFDLQIASIGFTLPGLADSKYRVPNAGYRTVRGSLEAYQQLDARNFVVNGLKILGPLLTGFTPFFHVTTHAKNFSEAINIVSNPLEKGLENFWPDLVPTELDRLADQTFRDDVSTKTIIPNNVQTRILTFVPRRLLFPRTPGNKKGIIKDSGGNIQYDPSKPQDVMRVLGDVVIIGRQVEYINRMRVVNTPFGASASDRAISGKITDLCNIGVGSVTMSLTGGSDFTARDITTSPDGTFNFPNVPIGRTYTVTPKLENMTFHPESPGSETFTLNDTKTNLNFGADYAVLVISGKVVDKDSKPAGGVTVQLTGDPTRLKADKTATTNVDGIYRFELRPSDLSSPGAGDVINVLTSSFKLTIALDANKNFTIDAGPTSKTWKCDQRQLDFLATPKPSPSPSPSPKSTP
jgi:hypothetical protein